MDSVLLELEKARKDLLDLGLRNTLLNYRPLRSKGLEVADELPDEVHRILVREGRSMHFLPAPEPEEDGETEVLFEQPQADDEVAIAARHVDAKLQTPHTSARLQRRLLNTYYAARTHLEEQGVNVLYLALGVLKWYEASSSDIERRAPLILVPVELRRSSVKTRFRLHYTGDEVRNNLSLQAKLRLEFGANLPIFEDEDLKIPPYFRQVVDAVKEQSRWSVDTSAIALGFFSFNKYLIFEDLDSDKWPEDSLPYQHPILSALLGEHFNESDPAISSEDYLDDHVGPADVLNVVDADSSQMLAILDVKQGRNLVIQGPPGTGKSQTISNIIAEALEAQKKVLFVSEKMAALEVVKRRLDNVGLGDTCLELHSHKTNKRSFLDELERVLEQGKPVFDGASMDLQVLSETRDRLNSYCRCVNQTIGQSGVTPYRAIGELSKLEKELEGIELPLIESSIFDGDPSADDVRRRMSLAEKIQALCARIGVPNDHTFWGTRRRVFLPPDRDQVQKLSEDGLRAVKDLRKLGAELAQALSLPEPTNRTDMEKLMRLAGRVADSPPLSGVSVKDEAWRTQSKELQTLVKLGAQLESLHKENDSILTPRAWREEVGAVRLALSTYGPKWWRIFSGDYRRARDVLASLCRTPPKELRHQLALVDAIMEGQRLEGYLRRHGELATRLFGPHWRDRESDWTYLSRVTNWLEQLHRDIDAGQLPPESLDVVVRQTTLPSLEDLIQSAQTHALRHSSTVEQVMDAVDLDERVRFDAGNLTEEPFQLQEDLLSEWSDNAASLQELVSFNHLADEMRDAGWASVVDIVISWAHADRFLTNLLRKTWYSKLLERALRDRPDLARFDGSTHEHDLKTFRKLDSEILLHNRALLTLKHWESLPRYVAGGQLGVLHREFAKKKRHKPIRKLMREAGNAIQAIKPVFMMSPLSIAAFVPPGTIEFDLVVFDEASQVRPVEAFGSILRGSQVVVVGDDRQLPPSSFFDKIKELEDEDLDSQVADMDSILDLFRAQGAPQRLLRWHYRSRHESLIAVSNAAFYRGQLVIFPSPDASRSDVGLVFRHLPGTAYEPGEGKRKNPEEARAVAKAVMNHARTRPELSLGVAAFGYAQMQEILDQIELLRREDPSCEEFFNAHAEEPFFVKNLENVQGDERDVVFISVGYGRTKEGYFSMNFGPVNQDGGERRLNVLITRARRRCEVFTNLTSDDIDLERAKGLGVVTLKRYLKYAQTGILDIPIPQPGKPPENPFEEAVANALQQYGYQVRHQVGSAGFYIDLAVIDDEQSGRYLIGIECDGATYHSARSARDRDRLRQEVLEDLGWTIHRVWSTDWFQDPERALRRIIESIEASKATKGSFPSATKKIDRGTGSPPQVQRATAKPRTSKRCAITYKKADLDIGLVEHGLDKVPVSQMQEWVEKVVEIESPVHIEEVMKRIADAAGVKRVGKRIRDAVERSSLVARTTGKVRRHGEFLWLESMKSPPIRDRSGLTNTSRKLELVAPEEITVAIESVVRRSMGIKRVDVPQEVGLLLGFGRVTKRMSQRVQDVMQTMIVKGALVDQGDSVMLSSPAQ